MSSPCALTNTHGYDQNVLVYVCKARISSLQLSVPCDRVEKASQRTDEGAIARILNAGDGVRSLRVEMRSIDAQERWNGGA